MATIVLALFTCAASAKTTRAAGRQDQAVDPVEQAAELLQQGFNDVGHDDASAATKLDEAIRAEGFGDLSADLRYRALLVASLIAQQNGENQKAHDLIVRATVFDEADDTAWLARLSSAFALGGYDDAARSLAVLAGRWPEKLGQLMPEAIAQLHYKLQGEHHSEIDGKLLDALFDAKWLVGGIEPSEMWRDLVLLHLERNEVERATAVALRITSGRVALSLLVDQRFDPITRERLQVFDVDRLVAAEIETAQGQMKAHPEQLEPVYNLQELFLITKQYPRVLSISDSAVAHAR